MHDALRSQIRRFISENFLFRDSMGSLGDEASFLDAGIIDSTGVLELISHLEATYGIEIADDEMLPENFDSVQRIVTYLERKLGLPASPAEDGPAVLSCVRPSYAG